MNNLIRTGENEDGDVVVSFRELHDFLGIETPFRKWFPRMIEYGFVENVDYTPDFYVHPLNKQETTDFLIKLDMAKEISMIQRSDKGKEARKYFLEIEKRWNSPEMIMKRALEFADQKVKELELKYAEMKPKALFAEAVESSKSSILIGEMAKILKQNGVTVGQNRMFEWLRENGYLIKQKGENFNLPTQKSMDLKIMEIKKRTINNPDGSVRVTRTTKITGKGQVYLVNKFLNDNQTKMEDK